MRQQCVCALIGSVACLLLPARASGEIIGIEVVETTYPGMPGFLMALNLYVTFDDPGDAVVLVLGPPGDPLRFETNVVTGFHQEPFLAGDFSVDSELLNDWPSLAWDTYVGIGYKSGDYGPADSDATEVVGIDFATWNDGGSFLETDFVSGGAYFVFDHPNATQNIAGPDLQVFIGQLVIVTGPTKDNGLPQISGRIPDIVWYRASTNDKHETFLDFNFGTVGMPAEPVTLHVGGDAPAGGDGTNWSSAFCFVKDALAAALAPGNGLAEIRVAQGVYRPDRSAETPNGSGDRGASFDLSGGVTLRGGYAGPGAPDPDARNLELYETILSGDLNGDDQPGFVNSGDNSYHVVFAVGGGPAAVLEGVTVTGGSADGLPLDNIGGGMLILSANAIVANCKFIQNAAAFRGGGIFVVGESTVVNCVFSRNTAEHGGGLYTIAAASVVNCTFSDNTGAALMNNDFTGFDGVPVVYNSIFWGNTPVQVGSMPDSGIGPVLRYCDIQGGWSGGSFNIDADPLFVPCSDDLWLSVGSPCVDAGYNPGLPPDTLDLDNDGDTAEPIPFDLAGTPRIVDAFVDMGAYEGGPPPLTAQVTGLDNGETVVVVPSGGGFDPTSAAVVVITNVSGPNGAIVTLSEWCSGVHPEAGGYSELTVMLDLETSLEDGQHVARVFIPFDGGDLNGADPLWVNLTYFDAVAGTWGQPAQGNWGLAVAGNTVSSPGSFGPIGDRFVAIGSGPGAWEVSDELGDYGVFWNPGEGKGFAWANVDHAAEFTVGVSLCPADCAQTPDGVVNVMDLVTLLVSFGPAPGGGPCDLDHDGIVGVLDLIELLLVFGSPCP